MAGVDATQKSAADIAADLTIANTKEAYRAGGAELMALWVRKDEEEIRSLREQVSALTSQREALAQQFHKSDKEVAVLNTKLQSILAQLRAQTVLDWMFNSLFTLGGVTVGVGVSWPDIAIGGRILVSLLGFLVLLVPVLYKSVLHPKTPMPE